MVRRGSDAPTNDPSRAPGDGFRPGLVFAPWRGPCWWRMMTTTSARCSSLQLMLSGYEPVEAATVDEGLRLLAERSPDLVLTDLNFGTDTGRAHRHGLPGRGQPVILMTASVETRELPESLRQDVPLLRKPFTLDDLRGHRRAAAAMTGSARPPSSRRCGRRSRASTSTTPSSP